MRRRWIALLLAFLSILLMGCQRAAEPEVEEDVAGEDWRTWGWVDDWGTLVLDGEHIDLLLCVFSENAVLFYDDATMTEFADLEYPYPVEDAQERYDSLSLLDKNGDDWEDVRIVFRHEDGMDTVFVWCWDGSGFVFAPELSGEEPYE